MKVLLIEPSQLFQKVIREIFSDRGREVVQVESTESALGYIEGEREQWLMIIMSLELGRTRDGKNAAEDFLLRLAKGSRKPVPIIVISTGDPAEIREKYYPLGVTDIVQKKDLNYNSFNRYLERLSRNDPVHERLRSLRFAVVDDSRTELNIIGSIFQLYGIHSAEYFSTAADLLASPLDFDIYLVDAVLPDLSGEETVRRLRAARPASVILVVSAFSRYNTLAPILDAGAQDYISKPFLPDVFMLRLRSAVRDLILLEALETHGISPASLL